MNSLQKMAQKGGLARAKKLSKERRSEIARTAILARWRKRELPRLIKALKNIE